MTIADVPMSRDSISECHGNRVQGPNNLLSLDCDRSQNHLKFVVCKETASLCGKGLVAIGQGLGRDWAVPKK